MATLIDLLRQLGHHAAPDGSNALVGPVVLPGVSDSPLTLTQPSAAKLVAAWSRLVGRTTLGHHALALSAAQTNYSVALMGHGSAPHDDLLLITLAQLLGQPHRVGMCIVPHEQSRFAARLTKLADTLGLSWLDATQPGARIRPATLVLTTPNELHRRILRFHDRAWRWLWPDLHVLALPELHSMTGAAAGHLHWVLRRAARLRPETRRSSPLHVFSSLAPVAQAEATLTRLLPAEIHYPLRIIAAPDGPAHNTLIALWRCDRDRVAPIVKLAQQLSARRVPIAVLGRDQAETEQLHTALAAAGIDLLSAEARVAIVSGVPPTSEARQALLRQGYRLALLLAGDEPHELLFAAQPDLLLQTLPYWPLALTNSYISAAQLVCAAAERPLEEAEIDRWRLRNLRDRLLKKGSLQPLPGSDLWQSTPEGSDPYANLDLRTIGEPPLAVRAPDGRTLSTLPPALLDQQALPGQIFAPGLRVAARDEQAGVVQLVADASGAETVVLAQIGVAVREEQAARTLHFGKITADLTKGKVLATQQIVGLREFRPDGTEQRLPLRSISETEWSAAACWIELPIDPAQPSALKNAPALSRPPDPQTIGWSITRVVPLIALATPGSLIATYNAEQQRLYLIEAEPGGGGLISGVYDQFERIIQLAIQLTLACAERPLYRRLAASEAAWLRTLSALPAPAAETPAPKPTLVPTPAETLVPAATETPAPKPTLVPTPVDKSASKPTTPAMPAPTEADTTTVVPRTPNILPFPTRRPGQERPSISSAERPAAAAAGGSSAQPSAAPAPTRVYPMPLPAPVETDQPSAAPVRPAAALTSAPAQTNSATPPAIRAPRPPREAPTAPAQPPRAPSAADQKDARSAEPVDVAPTMPSAAESKPTAAPIKVAPAAPDRVESKPAAPAPPTRHHASIYRAPEPPAPAAQPAHVEAKPDKGQQPAVSAPLATAAEQPYETAPPAPVEQTDQRELSTAPEQTHEPESRAAEQTHPPASSAAEQTESRAAAAQLEEIERPVAAPVHQPALTSAAAQPGEVEAAADQPGEVEAAAAERAQEPAPAAADQSDEVEPPAGQQDEIAEAETTETSAHAQAHELPPAAAIEATQTRPEIELSSSPALPQITPALDQAEAKDDTAIEQADEPDDVPAEQADEPSDLSVTPQATPPADSRRPVLPRRWSAAASTQFRIDDLLPPLPPEADLDDEDEPEPLAAVIDERIQPEPVETAAPELVEATPEPVEAAAPEPVEMIVPGRATVTPDEDFDVIDQAEPEPIEQAETVDQAEPEPIEQPEPAERTTTPSGPVAAPHDARQAEPVELTPAASAPSPRDRSPAPPAPPDADAAIVTFDSDDDFDDFNVRPRRRPAPEREAPSAAADESTPPERRSWREIRPAARANGRPNTIPSRPQKPGSPRGAAPDAGRANGSEPQPTQSPQQPPEREPSGYAQRRFDVERPASQPSAPRGRSPEPEAPAPRRTPDTARGPNVPPREPPRSTPRPTRAPEPEPVADVSAMIDRMRRLRQQREAEQQSTTPRKESSPARRPADESDEPVELRFHIGERVQCLPYGIGVVRASRIADGRELVQIEFPDYGEIEVDPAISLVRQLGPRADKPREDDQSDLSEE